jgi:hypothetical protein
MCDLMDLPAGTWYFFSPVEEYPKEVSINCPRTFTSSNESIVISA